MIKFGNIKSKIEEKLLESYSNNTFKTEMKNFKSFVLGNKNISKLFYLYDEMSSNKGINESLVNDYIYECITIYENTINKIEDNTILNLKKWVSNVNCENKYENIDNLFSAKRNPTFVLSLLPLLSDYLFNLNMAYKRSTTFQAEFKLSILERIKAGETVKQISHESGIAGNTIYQWVRRYLRGKKFNKK